MGQHLHSIVLRNTFSIVRLTYSCSDLSYCKIDNFIRSTSKAIGTNRNKLTLFMGINCRTTAKFYYKCYLLQSENMLSFCTQISTSMNVCLKHELLWRILMFVIAYGSDIVMNVYPNFISIEVVVLYS